jgi:hypothetical protein
MRKCLAALFLAVLCLPACARQSLLKTPIAVGVLPLSSSEVEKAAYFQTRRVHVIGANNSQVSGQSYDNVEMLRYYDDSPSGDASAYELKAISSVADAEDLAFDGAIYGSLGGLAFGGLESYGEASINDLNALDAFWQGALIGFIVGGAVGTTVGWSLFAWKRSEATNQNRHAASEFNHWLRTQLGLKAELNASGGMLKLEY